MADNLADQIAEEEAASQVPGASQVPQPVEIPAPTSMSLAEEIAAEEAGTGQQQESQLAGTVNFGTKAPYATVSRIAEMKAKTDLDEGLIERNLDRLEAETKKKDFDAATFRRSSPVLASWMAESPNNAGLAFNDLAKLGQLEKYSTLKPSMWPRSEAALEAEAERFAQAQIEKSVALPEIKADIKEQMKADYLERIRQDEDFISTKGKVGLAEHFGKRFRENPAFMVPFAGSVQPLVHASELYDAAKAAQEGSASDTQIDLLIRTARMKQAADERGEDFLTGVGDLVADSATFGAEFALTGPAFKIGQKAAYNLGAAAVEKTIQNVLKKVITNPRFIVTASHAPSAAVGALAQLPAAAALRIPMTAIQRMTPDGGIETKDGNVGYAVDPDSGESFGVALPKAIVDSFAELASERTGSLLQFAQKPMNKIMFGWWAAKHPGATAETFGRALKQAGFNGILGEMGEEEVGKLIKAVGGVEPYRLPTPTELATEAVGFAIPGVSQAALSRIGEGRAKEKADKRRELGALIQEMAVTKDAPAAAAKVMERLGQNGGDVYIEPEAFITYYQSQKADDGSPLDPREAAARILGSPEEFDAAVEQGREIKIPMKDYLTKVATSKDNEFFANEITEAPGVMNAREEEEFAASRDAQEAAEPKEVPLDDAGLVGETIRDQLLDAKVPEGQAVKIGKLWESRYRTRAERLGVQGLGPAELLRRWPLTVRLEGIPDLKIEPREAPAEQRIAARRAGYSPAERQLDVLIDPKKGTLNELARQMMPDEGGLKAHLSMSGLKAANEISGLEQHEHGDAILREAAQAIMEVAPNVTSQGPDFLIGGIRDQAQFEEILAAVNERMPDSFEVGGKQINAKAFKITGALGQDFEQAAAAHSAVKAQMRAAGTLADRGKFLEGALDIPEGAQPAQPRLNRAVISPELAAAHEATPEADIIKASSWSKYPGVLKRSAQQKLQKKAFQAHGDIRMLGKVDKLFGREAADNLKAIVLHQIKLVADLRKLDIDLAIGDGMSDEFFFQHNDSHVMEKLALDLSERLRYVNIEYKKENGETGKIPGAFFAVGIGGSDAIAESELGRAKKEQEADKPGGERGEGAGGLPEFKRGRGVAARHDSGGIGGAVPESLFGLPGAIPESVIEEEKRKAEFAAKGPGGLTPLKDLFRKNKINAPELKEHHPDIYSKDGQSLDRAIEHVLELTAMPPDSTSNDLLQQFDVEAQSVKDFIEKYGKAAYKKLRAMKAADDVHGFSELAQENEGKKKLGSLTPTPEEALMTLMKRHNRTTALHESWHRFFLEFRQDYAYISELDPETLTPGQKGILADGETILKAVEAKSFDPKDLTPTKHEKLAKWGEQYFMEGKSPSAELAPIFESFRAWFFGVYKRIQGLLQGRAGIDQEMRGVFDRMLASDEAIATAQEEQVLDAFPGLENDPEYLKTRAEASTATRVKLSDQMISELVRKKEAWYREEKAKVKERLTKELLEQQDYGTVDFLQKPGAKLSKKDIIENYGEEALKGLPRGILQEEGGEPIAEVYRLFGYTSADEMLKKLAGLDPLKVRVEREATAEMDFIYGDIYDDIEQRRAEAMKALHGEKDAKRLRMELDWISQKRAPVFKGMIRKVASKVATSEALKMRAARIVEGIKARDMHPDVHLRAEAKARRESVSLFLKGEFDGAFEAKQREALNHEIYKQSLKAAEAIDSAVKYAAKFDKDAVRKKIGLASQDSLEVIDQILDRYDFRRSKSLRSIDNNKSLAAWVAKQKAAGLDPAIPDDVLNSWNRVHYKNLTFSQIMEIKDVLKQIEHSASAANKLLKDAKKRALDEAVEAGVKSIVENSKGERPKLREKLLFDKAKNFGERALAMHRKFSSLIRQMDGFKDGGPLWELLVRPANEAADEKAVMNQDAVGKFTKIFQEHGVKEDHFNFQKEFIPEINESLTRTAQRMILLNWGNLDNRQKLLDGHGWKEAQVQAILNRMTEADLKWAQDIWDFIDSYWPEIKALAERVEGISPEKVEASPFETPAGKVRGGYFPLKYDDLKSPEEAAKDKAKSDMRGAAVHSTTRHGHRKDRVTGVERRIRLDYGVMFEHVSQVIQDLTHYEYLIDANRLLGDKRMKESIASHYGEPVLDTLKEAVTDIAAGEIGAQNAFEKGMGWIRTGSSIAAMGWNFGTALIQPLGLSQSVVRIGPKWVTKGLSDWFGTPAHMEKKTKEIFEKSTFMRMRSSTMMREISEIRNRMKPGGKFTGPVSDSFFWMIYKAQQVADIPTWLGAHEKALFEDPIDEARAVALADQAVIDAQGSGHIKDLAEIQRGGPLLKLWTNFYSFFNTTYNLTAEAVGKTKGVKDTGRLLVDLMLLYTVPAILGRMLRDAISGKGGDDDPEEWAKKMVKEQAAYLAGTMVGARELSGFIQGYTRYEGPSGVRAFSLLGKLSAQAGQGEMDEAAWDALNAASGVLFHYPASQIERTVRGALAIMEGSSINPFSLPFGAPKE